MPKLKYLVRGNHEGISEHLGRVTVRAALRKAKQLVQEGYIDVRICTPRGQVLLSDDFNHLEKQEETAMAKGQQRGNREAKKPKKEKIKVIAAAPSQKAMGSQSSLMPGRKK
jgi:predicted phosphohydrolase